MKSSWILTTALVLVLVACGGSDGAGGDDVGGEPTTTTTITTTITAGNDDATTPTTVSETSGQEVGEMGSISVNGTEFAVAMLNRCIPFQDRPGDIDLQALGQRVQLNLVLFGGQTEPSIQGGAIQEQFGSIAFGRDPVIASSEVVGNRWTGAATVGDSTGGDGTVDVTWDVMVPDEIRDCSL